MNIQTRLLTLAAAAICTTAAATSYAQETPSSQEHGVGPGQGHDERYTQIVLDGNFASSAENQTGNGGGGALRVGEAFPVGFLVFVPELGGDFFKFAGPQEAKTYGGFAGARMRFGRLVEPGLFAHVGVAGVDRVDKYAAPTVDLGITVDVTYFERVLLGVQGQYKSAIGTGGDPSFSFYTAGLSAGVKL